MPLHLSPTPMHLALAKALLGPRSIHVLGHRIASTLDDDVPWAFPLAASWLRACPPDLGRTLVWLLAFQPLTRWLKRNPDAQPAVDWIRDPRPIPAPALPDLPDVGSLARWLGWTVPQLDGHADRRDWHRHQPAFRDYLYVWRGHRLLEVPKDRLKRAQRKLYRQLLVHVPVHPSAQGFVPGRSVHSHAALHAGHPWVLRLDLACFFGNVHARRVHGVFRSLGYTRNVASYLTCLTTTCAPPDITHRPPYRQPHLPQGAPTSPALANAVAWRLDRRLHGLAVSTGLVYSRYADDLTFSGERPGRALRGLIERIVREEGFLLNPRKTRLQGRGGPQRVTGLVVNAHPAVCRAERDELRAVLHRARTQGWQAVHVPGVHDVVAWARGRYGWVTAAHPDHAARLGPFPEPSRT